MGRKLIIAAWIAVLVGGCVWSKEQAARRAARRFAERVEDADQLRIRNIAEKTLCELSGKKRVSDFATRLEFSELKGQCECSGGLFLELSRAGKSLLAMSYHHGTHLRCPECWKNDAYLSEGSRDWLVNWLAERGIAGPKREVESAKRRLRRW